MLWIFAFTAWPHLFTSSGAAFVAVEPSNIGRIEKGVLFIQHPKFQVTIRPLFADQLRAFLLEQGFKPELLERPGIAQRIQQILAFYVEVENFGQVDLHYNPNQVNLLKNDFPYGQRVTPLLFYSDPYLENEPELQRLAQFFETGNFTLSQNQKETQILAYHHSKARFNSRDTQLVIREIYFAAESYAVSGRLSFF